MIVIPAVVATAREATVAYAAPTTPSSGNGPHPKMRNGSSARLSTTVTSITSIGVMVSPYPRISDMKTKKPNMNTIPSETIRR